MRSAHRGNVNVGANQLYGRELCKIAESIRPIYGQQRDTQKNTVSIAHRDEYRIVSLTQARDLTRDKMRVCACTCVRVHDDMRILGNPRRCSPSSLVLLSAREIITARENTGAVHAPSIFRRRLSANLPILMSAFASKYPNYLYSVRWRTRE